MSLALKLAHDVLAMQDRIEFLAQEVIRLTRIEAQYNELLDSSLQHNKQTAFGLLAHLAQTHLAKETP